jgi:hypothetical protein
MKTHNFPPKHLKDVFICLASGLQILNYPLMLIASAFQSLDLLFEVFNYSIVIFIFALSWHHM